MITAVVFADEGGPGLLKTCDSLVRQASSLELLLALPGDRAVPLADSIARRLGATAIRRGSRAIAAVNEAVRLGRGQTIAIVPGGVECGPYACDAAAGAFERDSEISAIALPLVRRTPDGLGTIRQVPAVSAAALLADPASTPAAIFVRRLEWEALGGPEERWGGLAMYEYWLRLALARRSLRVVDSSVLHQDLPAAAAADEGRLDHAAFRRIVDHHRAAIEPIMDEVLVDCEVRFGAMRTRHSRLVAERDRDLVSLDGLRAEAAHHLAYLRHHGLEGFDWGDLRRTDPFSRDWGYDRGGPIDRHYIDAFIEARSSDVRGAVLEVQEDDLTLLAGGPRVDSSTIVDVDPHNPRAGVITDLRCAPELPSDRFDCVILTQTLHVIDDMDAVVREVHRVLRPGGVVLATLPAASRSCLEYGERGDLWRMTPAGARALFERAFGESVDVAAFGNVLTNTAFLHGLGAGELTADEYERHDPYFPALAGVRAKKGRAARRTRGVVLLYHRVDGAEDVHGLNTSPENFEAQLAWLARSRTIVPLETLLGIDEAALPDRAVALTFDDGYADNLDVAMPILERHGASATFFITCAGLDESHEYWWDALERLVLLDGTGRDLLDLRIAGERVILRTGSKDERIAAHAQLHGALVHATLDERTRVMTSIGAGTRGSAPRYPTLSIGQLRTLASRPGASIGAHSLSHLSLPDQPADAQRREVLDSRDRLASITGKPVTCFAYPYGAVDRSVARLVRRDVGWGLSCEPSATPASFDAALVPRVEVRNWPAAEFAARLMNRFSW